MNEYIIESQGYSDEILSANDVDSAKRKYKKKHPLRIITGVITNEPF